MPRPSSSKILEATVWKFGVIVMDEIYARCFAGLMTIAAIVLCVGVHASERSVDEATQVALSLDAHPDSGASKFDQYCVRCHGIRGAGAVDPSIPTLAGQRFVYLVRQLANFAGSERDSDVMHRVISRAAINGPQAWVDIAAYLDRVPPSNDRQVGDGIRVSLGRGIFHEQCSSCHRADARGGADGFVPSLRNQNYAYLLSQLHKMSEASRHNVDEDLVKFLRSFDEQDMRATADYLSRLRGAGSVHKVMRNDGVVVVD
jgi:cytochrome c553